MLSMSVTECELQSLLLYSDFGRAFCLSGRKFWVGGLHDSRGGVAFADAAARATDVALDWATSLA
eukprot:2754537-Amphidinium_carterae.1